MIAVSDLGSGGAQRVLCKLAEHWRAAGKSVHVVTLSDRKSDFFTLPPGVSRTALGLTGASGSLVSALSSNVRRIAALRAAIRAIRPKVAIGFIAPMAVLLVAAAAGTGVPVVAAERNDPTRQSFGWLWDTLRWVAYRMARRVTANSRGAVEALSGIVSPERLLFTPNPLPEPHGGPRADFSRPTILAVGRLHPQKALDVLLFAFSLVKDDTWQIVILGEGAECGRLQAQAEAFGLSQRVTFQGAISDPAPYYRAASIFALPSRHEGTPNALIEAMSYGCTPVVSDASPGPLDLVTDGANGLVVAVDDAQALSAALRRLMGDAALRARLGERARADMEARRRNDDAYARWDAAIAI